MELYTVYQYKSVLAQCNYKCDVIQNRETGSIVSPYGRVRLYKAVVPYLFLIVW